MVHYSSSSWKDYIDGKVGSPERILMEEHLAYCSECLEKYIGTLEASQFFSNAPEALTDEIMARVTVARRLRKLYLKNHNSAGQRNIKAFSKFAIAASIALMLWQFGIFGHLSTKVLEVDELLLSRPEYKTVLVSGFGDRMVNQINNFFNIISEKGDVLFNEKKK